MNTENMTTWTNEATGERWTSFFLGYWGEERAEKLKEKVKLSNNWRNYEVVLGTMPGGPSVHIQTNHDADPVELLTDFIAIYF